jgi:hypothetical protein
MERTQQVHRSGVIDPGGFRDSQFYKVHSFAQLAAGSGIDRLMHLLHDLFVQPHEPVDYIVQQYVADGVVPVSIFRHENALPVVSAYSSNGCSDNLIVSANRSNGCSDNLMDH